MVIELGCELKGLGEEGEGRAKLTSRCTVPGRHPHCTVVALLQVSDWLGSVSEDSSWVTSRLKEQKGRARSST